MCVIWHPFPTRVTVRRSRPPCALARPIQLCDNQPSPRDLCQMQRFGHLRQFSIAPALDPGQPREDLSPREMPRSPQSHFAVHRDQARNAGLTTPARQPPVADLSPSPPPVHDGLTLVRQLVRAFGGGQSDQEWTPGRTSSVAAFRPCHCAQRPVPPSTRPCATRPHRKDSGHHWRVRLPKSQRTCAFHERPRLHGTLHRQIPPCLWVGVLKRSHKPCECSLGHARQPARKGSERRQLDARLRSNVALDGQMLTLT